MIKELIRKILRKNNINEKLSSQLKKRNEKEISLLDNSIRDLYNLQDIKDLGISEEEKNKHRNIIINRLLKIYLQKINELSITSESLDNSNKK